MKNIKVLTALGGLVLSASTVWAQSSVSVYGLIDQAVGKNIGSTEKVLTDSLGSRLGFRGEEDLGNGAKVFFVLEHRLSPDTGAAQTPFFKGGSWVGVSGDWGKVTLGRQWSVAFLKTQYPSDPFGMTTVAGINYGTVGCGGAGGCVGGFWMDNAVTYERSFGGLSVGVQAGVDKAVATPSARRPLSFGISYGDGPLYLAYGYESHNSVFSTQGVGGDAKWHQATANYDFGAAKLVTGFGSGKDNTGADRRNLVLGVVVPVGPGKAIAQFNRHKESGSTVVSQVGLGYQYPLSKRTTLYTTLTRNGKSASKSGYDVGLLHTF